jgi:hypothetical protein
MVFKNSNNSPHALQHKKIDNLNGITLPDIATAKKAKQFMKSTITENHFYDLTDATSLAELTEHVSHHIAPEKKQHRAAQGKSLFVYLPSSHQQNSQSCEDYLSVGEQQSLGAGALGVYVVGRFDGTPLTEIDTVCIPKGQFVVTYEGERIKKTKENQKTHFSDYVLSGLNNLINPEFTGTISRFFNHSSSFPNLEAIPLENGDVGFFALRDIYFGEELLFNYGETFFDHDHMLHFNPCFPGWMSSHYLFSQNEYRVSSFEKIKKGWLLAEALNFPLNTQVALSKSHQAILAQNNSELDATTINLPMLIMKNDKEPFLRNDRQQIMLSPLFLACSLGYKNSVLELLKHPQIHKNFIEMFSGKNAFHFLLEGIGNKEEKHEIMVALLAHGVSPTQCDNTGVSPLHLAVFLNLEKCVDELLAFAQQEKTEPQKSLIDYSFWFLPNSQLNIIARLAPLLAQSHLSAIDIALLFEYTSIIEKLASCIDFFDIYRDYSATKLPLHHLGLLASFPKQVEYLNLPHLIKIFDTKETISSTDLCYYLLNDYCFPKTHHQGAPEIKRVRFITHTACNQWYLLFARGDAIAIKEFGEKMCAEFSEQDIATLKAAADKSHQQLHSEDVNLNPELRKKRSEFVEFLFFIATDSTKMKKKFSSIISPYSKTPVLLHMLNLNKKALHYFSVLLYSISSSYYTKYRLFRHIQNAMLRTLEPKLSVLKADVELHINALTQNTVSDQRQPVVVVQQWPFYFNTQKRIRDTESLELPEISDHKRSKNKVTME